MTEPLTFDRPPAPCPICLRELSAATAAVGHDRSPKEGDWTVCYVCGELLRFTATGLRLPATVEFASLEASQIDQLFAIQERVRAT